ncbi:Imm72 family immunity protein [Glaciimonas sp. Gout2]|uniref:Imm72 family immunity protein n=1 Tax=unclassified Glaciimonas TaxID=2644401 RepID=UPI002B226F44|nr:MULTISPECIES: Imm72 family immunity protein [unclassified Glaciimonas]MEB0014043.1 Imm72 family immunity protein [Glaciimonas sp. Cout2]MEB0083375.1 Imm72 family immunity protein [Glaciimonas sp. Gout2]
MQNRLTMTPEQEPLVRDQAFYLLKKYTSFTFIDQARLRYQGFLDAFLKQLKNLSPALQNDPDADFYQTRHEYEYKEFLRQMIPMEQGLALLRSTPHKTEAYETLSLPSFIGQLFGRYADEKGVYYDPFYIALGMTNEYPGNSIHPSNHTAFVKDVMNASVINFTQGITVFECKNYVPFHLVDMNSLRQSQKWTYETLFFEPEWPIPRIFPEYLPSCPPYNHNHQDQIFTGGTIPTDGIWEPWFIMPIFKNTDPAKMAAKVGCPNYFLAGAVATEYQLEGTDTWEEVWWRLLWEDKRYLDGTIPAEEADYLKTRPPVAPQIFTDHKAYPGDVCPITGNWHAPHMQGKTVRLEAGNIMAGSKINAAGNAVTWYLKV